MKAKFWKVFMISVFLLGFLGSGASMIYSQESADGEDNYGTIRGRIVDAQNGKAAGEAFFIRFYDCSDMSNPKYLYYRTTEQNGDFEYTAKPGTYYLAFCPKLKGSKYRIDPSPKNPGNITAAQLINVERGKITHFLKKAGPGSRVLIKLVDQTGKPIDPKRDYNPKAKLSIFVNGDTINRDIGEYVLTPEDDPSLSNGEYLIWGISPGTIDIRITFENMGYGGIEKGDIVVKENETRELEIALEESHTGIKGRVVDQHENPIKSAKVYISGNSRANTLTNANGYFKFVGIKEGKYFLNVSVRINGRSYGPLLTLNVKHGAITNRNIVIKVK